jgi:hypothetical protein
MNETQIAAAEAARDQCSHKTPAVILDAFLPEQIKVGNIALNPVTMSTIMVLEKLQSPFLGGGAEMKYQHIAEALCVFSQPIATVREALRNGTFQALVDSLADQLDMAVLAKAVPAIAEHIGKAFETSIPYGEGKTGPLAGHPSQTADSGGF